MKNLKWRITALVSGGVLFSVFLVFVMSNIGLYYNLKTYIKEDKQDRIPQILDYIKNVYEFEGEFNESAINKIEVSPLLKEFDISIHDSNHRLIFSYRLNQGMMNMMPMMRNFNSGNYIAKQYVIERENHAIAYVELGYLDSLITNENQRIFFESINKSIVYSAIISLVISLVFGILGSKVIYSPIRDLRKMAIDIKNGRFENEIEIKNEIIEIDELSLAMNSLLKSLKNQGELRKRLTMDISHELKTPLSIIYSQISGIKDGIYKPDNQRLEIIENQIEGLNKIINQLKNLNDIESRLVKLEFEEFVIEDLLIEVCKSFEVSFEKKGLNLNYKNIDSSSLIWGDRLKLKQVFMNVLSNSLKFTDYGGVDVDIIRNKEELKISICDTGIGIEDKDLEFIFERFYRSDKSRSKKSGGMGIGLSIAKSIIDQHKGKISVESEFGKGTCIYIRLLLNIKDLL